MGIGGGGDVAGALAAAGAAERLGTPAELGGITWERRPIDPLPGPRTLDEVAGARRLHAAAALAGPDTTGPGGFHFAESRMAGVLGRPVALIDPTDGPRAIAAGLVAAAGHLDCDLLVLLDVGGDVLAHGEETGLASPLADALLLAAAPHTAAAGLRTIGVVFGAGCDGELTPTEVRTRYDEIAAGSEPLGETDPPPSALDRLDAALAHVPTEASAMALRCARGETGTATIRDGRRTVQLTALGGRLLWFEPEAAIAGPARVAAAVADARGLREAHDTLTARGIRTELAYELDAAAEH
ncbi:MAG TPA: DUF1152 domain-containing protein [Solirubrobacteraceae bacterium]|nr:DUF1152 domain-containing protein [Solirubrobacteraceae bacterium]